MKKKRRLVIDEQKLIPSDTMRAQLRRVADLVVPLELAPPTKRLMEWKDVGGVEKLMILPGRHIGPTKLRHVSMFMSFVGGFDGNITKTGLLPRTQFSMLQTCSR